MNLYFEGRRSRTECWKYLTFIAGCMWEVLLETELRKELVVLKQATEEVYFMNLGIF